MSFVYRSLRGTCSPRLSIGRRSANHRGQNPLRKKGRSGGISSWVREREAFRLSFLPTLLRAESGFVRASQMRVMSGVHSDRLRLRSPNDGHGRSGIVFSQHFIESRRQPHACRMEPLLHEQQLSFEAGIAELLSRLKPHACLGGLVGFLCSRRAFGRPFLERPLRRHGGLQSCRARLGRGAR